MLRTYLRLCAWLNRLTDTPDQVVDPAAVAEAEAAADRGW